MIVRARFRDAEETVEPKEAASAEARLLALAYVVEQAVESGRYRSVAEVATALGLSRSRLSQILRVRWSPDAEQHRVLGARPQGVWP